MDSHPCGWWELLKSHPHARVLATLATKIFAALVNSMPDERTGSVFTWFNSPLCANQSPQTLIDMIQIGQWYRGNGQKGSGRAREPKTPYRPVVKFRDMDDDLLRSIAVAEGSSQDADPPHGDESDSADDASTSRRRSRLRGASSSSSSTSGSAAVPGIVIAGVVVYHTNSSVRRIP
ncbi:hypothetical protein V8E55_006506 [Tylopilus felleus]